MQEPRWKSAMRELGLRQYQSLTQAEWDEVLGLLVKHKTEMEPLIEEVIRNGPADVAFEVVDNSKSTALTSLLMSVRIRKNLTSLEYDKNFPEPLRQARDTLRKGKNFYSMSFCSLEDLGDFFDEHPRTVIVSFYLSTHGSYALCCWKPDGSVRISRIDLGTALTNHLSRLRPWLLSFDKRHSLAANPEMYALLMSLLDEIGQILQQALYIVGPIRHLVIVPHKELYCLPLHATRVRNQSGDLVPLCSLIPEISYAPSAMFTVVLWDAERALQIPRDPGGPRIMVVVDPRDEFADERRVWDVLFSGFSSELVVVDTKSDFLASYENCDVIHFACHGLSSLLDYSKSGLDLGNERISFVQVLEELNLLQCRNVTLAACETGASTLTSYIGDEYSGLDCSFILSGASGTVSTLWPVSHNVSVLFSAFYYMMVFAARVSPAYALNRFQHFLYTGDMQNLLRATRDTHNQEGNSRWADLYDRMLELSGDNIDWLDMMGWRIMGMAAYPLFGTGKPDEYQDATLID